VKAEWRPLPAWPYAPSAKAKPSFEVSWTKTLDDLEREIGHAKGTDVLIGVVFADEAQFRLDGQPKAGFKVKHQGAEVSFTTPDRGRVTFHTDAFGSLQENLRAISLGLTALRAIDRYGITTSGEQYAGLRDVAVGRRRGPRQGDRGATRLGREGAARDASRPRR
jgi:hypothetical protein